MPLYHTNKIEKQIRSLKNFFDNKAPRVVGTEAKKFFIDSFNKQGWDDGTVDPWEQRKTRSKNTKTRKLLIKTSRLKASFKYKPIGRGKVFVYTADVPYAKIHNEGGIIDSIQNIREHNRRTKRSGTVEVKAHKRHVKTKIPKRQFMGNSKSLNLKIEKELERRITKIMNNV